MIKINEIHYSVKNKGKETELLQGVTCSMESGKLYTILGEPQMGSSALMTMLCGLETPTKGSILVDGEDISLGSPESYRRDKVSIIHDNLLLFPHLTVMENIKYPMGGDYKARPETEEKVYELMDLVGLPRSYAKHLPEQLSHEEKLRTAIARCLVTRAKIILVRGLRWTSPQTEDIISLLYDLAHSDNYCVVVSTSSERIANHSDETFEIMEGQLTAFQTMTSSRTEATSEIIENEVDKPRQLSRDMITFESSYIYVDGEYRSK